MIHSKHGRRLASAGVAALLPLAASLASQAAFAAGENAGGIEEVVVTAQFREQNLQDTPVAITAVNAEIMESRSQTNLAQVADSAPSVTLKPQGASFGPSITASIRGIGQNDFSPAYEPGVGIYIDDVYFPSLTGAVFDLLDLDRVEILRGPQGTLAGRNSEGGSIKMYSKKPTGENSGFAEVTAGSSKRLGLRASGDFKIAEGISARISGVFKKQDGYVDQLDFGCVHPAGTDPLNPAGGIPRVRAVGDCRVAQLGGVGYQAVRAILRINPTDNFDLMLSADTTHDAHTIAGEVLTGTTGSASANIVPITSDPAVVIPFDDRFICGKYCNYETMYQPAIVFHGPFTPPAGQPILATNGSNQSVYNGYNLGANLHWGLNDMFSIDNILAYQHFDTKWDSDDDLSPANLNVGHNVQTHWNWSEELRLNAKFNDAINAVFGGYYFKQRSVYWSYQDIRYVPVYPLQFIQPDYVPADSKAAFANFSWEIASNLNLNAGLRYTKEGKEYHYFRFNPDGTVNPYMDPIGAANGVGSDGALSGSVARYSGSKTDYRAALDYRFSPQLMVYASIATGFKGGGTNPRPFYATQVVSFDPETVTSYEAGLKSDLFERRLRVNLTGFFTKLKDAQIGVTVCPGGNPAPCAARLNAGDADSKGVELELLTRPVDGLTIDGSYSYLNFHFTSLLASAEWDPVTNPGGGASKDDPAAGVPKTKWTLGAQYEIPVGGGATLTPRLDANYQDKIYVGSITSSGGTVRTRTFMDSYTLMNARLTWRNAKQDLDISAEVTNLTDEYYYLTAFNLKYLGAQDKAQPGRPREWAITIKKKF